MLSSDVMPERKNIKRKFYWKHFQHILTSEYRLIRSANILGGNFQITEFYFCKLKMHKQY